MTISFGVEFEFNHLDKNGNIGSHLAQYRYATVNQFNYQADPTAGSEIRSPIWTDINQAIKDIGEQFSFWIQKNNGVIPYPYNTSGTSLGQHIHIGKPHGRLTISQKQNIARSIAHVYPFLASIHAQPIPSRRGLYSNYCYSIAHDLQYIPIADHYAEISESNHGTVEFRLFDSNIPQVSMTVIFFMQKIAENNLSHNVSINELKHIYQNDRNKGLQYGVKSLNIIHYLTKAKELGNINELPNIACVKEILYLVAKYGMNPYDILQYSHANHYHYFKNQYLNPSEFLGNVLQISNIQHKDKLEQIKQEASQITTIDQLIEIAQNVVQALIRTKLQEINLLSRQELTRQEVRQAIQNNQYIIKRIAEVPNMTRREVAERISFLLMNHGEGFTVEMSAEEVINAEARFYVFAVKNPRTNQYEIIGNISLAMASGLIGNLVVDRRFRRLGISKILLQYVLTLRNKPFYAYVRKNNVASLNLFKSFGFQIVEEQERSYKLELRWYIYVWN